MSPDEPDTLPAGGATLSEAACRAEARVLAVDIGAGTADLLLTRVGEPLENAVKLVVPARTQIVAAQIAAATAAGRGVLFTGPTMGGGADGAALRRHLAAGLPFAATTAAALTFDDDLERLQHRGLTLLDEAAGASVTSPAPGTVIVHSGDLDPRALRTALALLGANPACDVVAVAVQDHGFSPHVSNRVTRFAFWRAAVAEHRRLTELFYDQAEIPAAFTRLRAAAGLAAELAPAGRVLAADSGPAALYGALPEGTGDAVLINVGNGHTLCAVARAGRLAGVFEHHTERLDGPGLESRLRRFLQGDLSDDAVRDDGGHGAVLADGLAGSALPALPLMVTGPRRALLQGSALPLQYAAPHGDMMLTGCFGLLRACREHGLTS